MNTRQCGADEHVTSVEAVGLDAAARGIAAESDCAAATSTPSR